MDGSTASEVRGILETMDELADAFTFPGFDNTHYATVDARLHCLTGWDEAWALVIEELVHWPAAAGIMRLVTTIDAASDEMGTESPVQPARWRDADGRPLRPSVVTVGERQVALDWREIDRLVQEADVAPETAGLVQLAERCRLELFASPAEVEAWAPDLKPVLTVDEWRHPDVYGDEHPSASEAMRQVARVLATGDPSHWRPTERPNNRDWRSWIERDRE